VYQSTDLLSEGGGGEDFFLERFAFRIVQLFPAHNISIILLRIQFGAGFYQKHHSNCILSE
jgi:hypothetical protein